MLLFAEYSTFFALGSIFDASVGTEELGHLEMIGAVVHQLTRDLSVDEIKKAGFDAYFVDHTAGVYPTAASGFPWSAASMAVKGDVIADLNEDLMDGDPIETIQITVQGDPTDGEAFNTGSFAEGRS